MQDAFSSVVDCQWLSWGSLLLPELRKLVEVEEAECKHQVHLEEIHTMEEASRKAKEDRRIAGREAMANLLENSEGMSAEDFASRIHSIKCEFGLVSVEEGGDNAMEVSEGENTGDLNRSHILVNQDHPKPCPLTKPRLITFELVDTDEDNDNESEDSDVMEVCTLPSKTGSKLSGRSKCKQSLGEVEVTREGGQGWKVCCKLSWKVTSY